MRKPFLSFAIALLFTANLQAQDSIKSSTGINVTSAMLHQPDDGDWLNWRRTDDAWGYSPLKQINKDNVNGLQLAWSWAMNDTASNHAAPSVPLTALDQGFACAVPQ